MLDDELRVLLSADPSADFTSRVREAVRHDTRRRSRTMHGGLALAATVVFVVWLINVPEHPADTSASWLTATFVGSPAVGLRAVVSDVRPAGPRPLSRFSSHQQPSRTPPRFQWDPLELRALQALFADPPAVSVDFPEPVDNAIVIPAMTVAPLNFESLSQGSSQ